MVQNKVAVASANIDRLIYSHFVLYIYKTVIYLYYNTRESHCCECERLELDVPPASPAVHFFFDNLNLFFLDVPPASPAALLHP